MVQEDKKQQKTDVVSEKLAVADRSRNRNRPTSRQSSSEGEEPTASMPSLSTGVETSSPSRNSNATESISSEANEAGQNSGSMAEKFAIAGRSRDHFGSSAGTATAVSARNAAGRGSGMTSSLASSKARSSTANGASATESILGEKQAIADRGAVVKGRRSRQNDRTTGDGSSAANGSGTVNNEAALSMDADFGSPQQQAQQQQQQGAVPVPGPGIGQSSRSIFDAAVSEDKDKDGGVSNEFYPVSARLVTEEETMNEEEMQRLRRLMENVVTAEKVVVTPVEDNAAGAGNTNDNIRVNGRRNSIWKGVAFALVGLVVIIVVVVAVVVSGSSSSSSSTLLASDFPTAAPSTEPPNLSPTRTRSLAPSSSPSLSPTVVSCISPPNPSDCSYFPELIQDWSDKTSPNNSPCTTVITAVSFRLTTGNCGNLNAVSRSDYDCYDIVAPSEQQPAQSYLVSVSDLAETILYFEDTVQVDSQFTVDVNYPGVATFHKMSIFGDDGLVQVMRYNSWFCSGNAVAEGDLFGFVEVIGVETRNDYDTRAVLGEKHTPTGIFSFKSTIFNRFLDQSVGVSRFNTFLVPDDESLKSIEDNADFDGEIFPGTSIIYETGQVELDLSTRQNYQLYQTLRMSTDAGLECDDVLGTRRFEIGILLPPTLAPTVTSPSPSVAPTPSSIAPSLMPSHSNSPTVPTAAPSASSIISPGSEPDSTLPPTTACTSAERQISFDFECEIVRLCGYFDVSLADLPLPMEKTSVA